MPLSAPGPVPHYLAVTAAIAICAIVLATIAVASAHGGFGLDLWRGCIGRLLIERDKQPILFFALFFAVYVAVTALCIPVEVLFALAAGALFGVTGGIAIASFASAIGATLAFQAARVLLRERLRRRFGPQMAAITKGFEENGIAYLISLRLQPILPFSLCNILMGQTGIRTSTFYLVTQACMLFATIIFVSAGSQIATLRSLSDLISGQTAAVLAALALVPLLGKLIVRCATRVRS